MRRRLVAVRRAGGFVCRRACPSRCARAARRTASLSPLRQCVAVPQLPLARISTSPVKQPVRHLRTRMLAVCALLRSIQSSRTLPARLAPASVHGPCKLQTSPGGRPCHRDPPPSYEFTSAPPTQRDDRPRSREQRPAGAAPVFAWRRQIGVRRAGQWRGVDGEAKLVVGMLVLFFAAGAHIIDASRVL